MSEPDAIGIMGAAIRLAARELKYGKLYYPTLANPALIMEVHDGVVKQVDVLFEQAKLDEDGKPILPERVARYRAD
ncbi:hypothetical protein ES703_121810 [subsurface metagenome]